MLFLNPTVSGKAPEDKERNIFQLAFLKDWWQSRG